MMVTSTQGSPWFCRSARALIQLFIVTSSQIVPTLRVGMHTVTLCVTTADAERPRRHSHAERGNDQASSVSTFFAALNCRICSQPHNTRSGVAGASIFG
ncbi:hypothetical protein FEM54_01640 [Pseudomonas edaphica]|uniref:Secreted protein n=1 Tax=Pseudomonas edaphica TaxID=2006980 RepID=A0ABY2UGR2_9PSED|nr:hypothetical protein FEM54_01640 [Pseudomonas edaphica]